MTLDKSIFSAQNKTKQKLSTIDKAKKKRSYAIE
jgi:hypothetical protein